MYTKETFATRLKELLQEHGLSQRALADKLNTTEATVSRYVAGARTPNIETAVEIARILGVSMDTLVGVPLRPIEKLMPDVSILMTCYNKMNTADRRVLWSLLDRYMAPSERVVITAILEETADSGTL